MPEAVAASPKGKNVWEELLAKAASGTRVRDMNVLVVGDWGAGKKALVSTLVGEHAKRKWAEDPQAQRSPMQDFVQSRAVSMAGLGYTFMDVKVDDEASAKVGMWVMDDKSRAKELMLNCLPDAQALQTAAAVIVLDLSKPWKALETLRTWSQLLKDHVAHIAGDLLPDLQDEVEAFTRAAKPSSGEVMRLADLLGPSRADAPPLVQGSLSENIGLPLLVVGTKADIITAAADDIETELRLEFIQRHIRQFCLKYGASLTYTSSKLGQNCSLLFDYMLHRMFPTIVALPNQTGGVEQEPQDNMRPSPIISIRDGVHIPAGWDHQQLIDALANSSNQRFAAWTSLAFEEVVFEPSKQSAAQDELNGDEEVALPYQEFLQSLLKKQKALPSPSHKQFGNVSAAAVKGFDEIATSSSQPRAAQEMGSSEPRKATPSPKTSAAKQTSSARRDVTVQDATDNPDKVHDFFTSLLKEGK